MKIIEELERGLDPDFGRIEKLIGKQLDDTEKAGLVHCWKVFFPQILSLCKSYKRLGFMEGKTELQAKLAAHGAKILAQYNAEYSQCARDGDLRKAMRFAEKRKILAELWKTIENF